jgi:hypothetical protein
MAQGNALPVVARSRWRSWESTELTTEMVMSWSGSSGAWVIEAVSDMPGMRLSQTPTAHQGVLEAQARGTLPA